VSHHSRLKCAEDLKNTHDHEVEKMYKKTVRTWAGNEPRHARPHANWKHYGVLGYTGHYPNWKIDEDFYSKPELGKVHPPYQPTVRYATSMQAPNPFGPTSLEESTYPWGQFEPDKFSEKSIHSGRSRSSSSKPVGSGRGPLGSNRARPGPRGMIREPTKKVDTR